MNKSNRAIRILISGERINERSRCVEDAHFCFTAAAKNGSGEFPRTQKKEKAEPQENCEARLLFNLYDFLEALA